MIPTVEEKFKDVYGQLLDQFKIKLKDNGIDYMSLPDNLPAPFIPDFGEQYEKCDFKFAFVGQDANYNYQLKNFFNYPDILKYSDIINYDSNDPTAYPEFLDYTKGNSFWKFILKFLALFYGIDDWKKLSEDWNSEQNKMIISSFVHGNVNSIPKDFPGIEKSKGVDYETWSKIKNASRVFDKLSHITDAFNPKVIILLHWHAPDEWFPEQIGNPEKFDPIKLWYYFIEDTKTHLYWTYHPSGMRNVDPDEILSSIIKSMREKEIFKSHPK